MFHNFNISMHDVVIVVVVNDVTSANAFHWLIQSYLIHGDVINGHRMQGMGVYSVAR